MASSYGTRLKISVFGESHGDAVGVTIEGFPAGFRIDMAKLGAFMKRRAPGQNSLTTPRKEQDEPEFLSGVLEGVTTGAPVTVLIRNTNTRSRDYEELRDVPRPGHADYTGHVKYGGHEDVRGGGHFSARLMAPLTAAGGIALQILEEQGIRIRAELIEAGGLPVKGTEDPALREIIEKARREEDSVGGVISCRVTGVPAGKGEPMFDGAENVLSRILFAIPALKGIEFGSGFSGSRMKGSENNDSFYYDEDGAVRTRTNNAGGILGGITTGMPIEFRAAFKPTPSIGKEQESISYSKKETVRLKISGRHDPCVAVRAVPVVEACAAIAVMELMSL